MLLVSHTGAVARPAQPSTSSQESRPGILIFADHYLPGFKAGGPIRSLANLVDRLGDEFRFRLVSKDRDAGDDRPYEAITANSWQRVHNTDVLYLSPGNRRPDVLRRIIASSRCSALYLNSFFSPVFTISTLMLRRVGLLSAIAVVVAPRGELSANALSLKKVKKRAHLYAAKASGIYRNVIWHASSPHEEDEIRKWFGASARVMVAPNLVDAISNAFAGHRSKTPGRLAALFLSRISRKKNLDTAIRILAEVPGEIEFNIYGPVDDQPYWKQCQTLITTLPKNIRVTYHGALRHDQVHAVLSKHHLFFMPTLNENFGHAISEALVAGCPVLISDQTPWRNLEQKDAGWDIPLNKPDLFRRALRRCVEMDEQTLNRWSANARELGLTGFNEGALEQNRRLLRLATAEAV